MKKIIIVGAGVAGLDVYREIKRSPELNIKIVGFIDDDPLKQNLPINGTKVLGSKKNLRKILKNKKIDEIIIAIPSAQGETINEYIQICIEKNVSFKVVPRVREIIEGKAYLNTLRKPKIEDLLGRPVVKSDVTQLKQFFKGKTVFITGAAGSIGSELSRQISAYAPSKLILYDWWENGMFELENELKENFSKQKYEFVIGNIQDKRRLFATLHNYKPNYLFHAAAYKHVPAMEENPQEAIKNNVFGTHNVILGSKKNNVNKVVIVSTDKAAMPQNIMGATKLITEALGKKYNGRKTKIMAVRFGNVLGSHGSVIPIFEKQIENGGPVTVTDIRMTRYFMTIPEAAQLILKAGSMGEGGELFVLDMGTPVKIIDLAHNVIKLHGLMPEKDVKIIYTGIRKGEKLHEKLFNEKENLDKTKDERIFVSQSQGIDDESIDDLLEELRVLVKTDEEEKIKNILKKYISSIK